MTEAALRALTVADTAAIQCGLALVIGSLASRRWLRRATSPWAGEVVRISRRWLVAGLLLALAADSVALWLQAVVLLDGPSTTAGGMMVMVLRETHFGHAWWFGAAALSAALLGSTVVPAVTDKVVAVATAVFVASRSVVSHAGDQGDFSLKIGVDWIHLVVVSLWVGIVLVGVSVVLRRQPKDSAGGVDAVQWVSAMSKTATVALVAIVLTGMVKVWWATPSWQLLAASTYVRVLIVKLSLVGVAVALGGFNRFSAMPGLLTNLADPTAARASFRSRFSLVLRLEAVVLVCTVVAAAVLSGTALPGEE